MKRDMKAEKKIMNVLLDNVGGEKMYLSQIARSSGASISTCYQILERKVANKEIEKVKVGNLNIYFLDPDDPSIPHLKLARAIELLKPLINKLQEVSQKIILFGSASRGEDAADSDFDLFVLSNEKDEVRKIIRKSRVGRKIKPVVRNFLELIELKRKDKVFYEEIKKGKILWGESRGR